MQIITEHWIYCILGGALAQIRASQCRTFVVLCQHAWIEASEGRLKINWNVNVNADQYLTSVAPPL
jgi:hypothetical protein